MRNSVRFHIVVEARKDASDRRRCSFACPHIGDSQRRGWVCSAFDSDTLRGADVQSFDLNHPESVPPFRCQPCLDHEER
jgi:hypothetical protein